MYLSVLAVILPAFAEETRWLVVFALKLSANLSPSLPYRYEGGTTVNESYNGHVATHRLASSLQLDWFSLLTCVHTISMGISGRGRRRELAFVDCRCCRAHAASQRARELLPRLLITCFGISSLLVVLAA